MESGGGGKPLGRPPGGGEEGSIDVVWRSFIQMMRRILFGILNTQGEEDSLQGEERERDLRPGKRERARGGEQNSSWKPSRKEEGDSGDAAGRERLGLHALDGVEARCITTALLERASEREIASWQENARAREEERRILFGNLHARRRRQCRGGHPWAHLL